MNRHEARAAAMKLIYEWDMGGDGGQDTLEGMLEIKPGEAESEYAQMIVQGVKDNVDTLDEIIRSFSHGWTLDRFSRVDLAILRAATYEMEHGDAPKPVVVNEAVELSREYSTDKSGGFINGVLGSFMRAGTG